MTLNIWLSSFLLGERRRYLQLLTSGSLHLAVLLETDGGHVDEAGRLGGGEVTDLVHGGLGHVVQLLGLGVAAQNRHVALVGTATNDTVDGLLGGGDGGLEELTLGGEVHAVIQELRVVEGNERVTQSADLTVHHKTLKVAVESQQIVLQVDCVNSRKRNSHVSSAQAGKTGGLVAATGLDADESVLDLGEG